MSEEFFSIEAILDKRTRKGRVEYLVKWEGYGDDDNTWETRQHMVEDGMKAFITKYEKAKKGTSAKKSKKKEKTPKKRSRSKTPTPSRKNRSKSKAEKEHKEEGAVAEEEAVEQQQGPRKEEEPETNFSADAETMPWAFANKLDASVLILIFVFFGCACVNLVLIHMIQGEAETNASHPPSGRTDDISLVDSPLVGNIVMATQIIPGAVALWANECWHNNAAGEQYSKWVGVSLVWFLAATALRFVKDDAADAGHNQDVFMGVVLSYTIANFALALGFTSSGGPKGQVGDPPLRLVLCAPFLAFGYLLFNMFAEGNQGPPLAAALGVLSAMLWRASARIGYNARTWDALETLPQYIGVIGALALAVSQVVLMCPSPSEGAATAANSHGPYPTTFGTCKLNPGEMGFWFLGEKFQADLHIFNMAVPYKHLVTYALHWLGMACIVASGLLPGNLRQ